jgi:hypothetical protein
LGGGAYRSSGRNAGFFSMRLTRSKIYSIHWRKAWPTPEKTVSLER